MFFQPPISNSAANQVGELIISSRIRQPFHSRYYKIITIDSKRHAIRKIIDLSVISERYRIITWDVLPFRKTFGLFAATARWFLPAPARVPSDCRLFGFRELFILEFSNKFFIRAGIYYLGKLSLVVVYKAYPFN
jgi:hypothetical protein